MIRPALLITGVLLVLLAAYLGWGTYDIYHRAYTVAGDPLKDGTWDIEHQLPVWPHPARLACKIDQQLFAPPEADTDATDEAARRQRIHFTIFAALGAIGVTLIARASIRRILREVAPVAALLLVVPVLGGCHTAGPRDRSLYTLHDVDSGWQFDNTRHVYLTFGYESFVATSDHSPRELVTLGQRAAVSDRREDRFVILTPLSSLSFYGRGWWPPLPYPREEVRRERYGIVFGTALTEEFAAGYNTESKRAIERRHGPDVWDRIERDTQELFLERIEDLPADSHARRIAWLIDASSQTGPHWPDMRRRIEQTMDELAIQHGLTVTISHGDEVREVVTAPYRYATPRRKRRVLDAVRDPYATPHGEPDLRPALSTVLQFQPEVLIILTHDPVAHDGRPGAADRLIAFIRDHTPTNTEPPKVNVILWSDADADDADARAIAEAFDGIVKRYPE